MLGAARRWRHVLVILVGWGLFFWSWRRVTAAGPEAGELRILMLGALLDVPPVTIGWVLHNVGIYRRKGPRRAVPSVRRAERLDFNGRRIVADWDALATARHIVIEVEDDIKRIRAAPDAAPAAADAVMQESHR